MQEVGRKRKKSMSDDVRSHSREEIATVKYAIGVKTDVRDDMGRAVTKPDKVNI
jgi:hypothetical protein